MLKDILGYISAKKIGYIKLDIAAHLFISVMIFFILKKYFNSKKSILIVFGLSILKEIYDTQVMTNTYLENLKDVFFSIIGPFSYIVYRKLSKNHIEVNPRE